MMNIDIREETSGDIEAIFRINSDAFPSDAEAHLVNTIRDHGQADISLVAEAAGEVVGHILFSPVTLSGKPSLEIAGLAPMSVLSELQNKGIGSLLVRAGLKLCKTKGYRAAVVLGHPNYYPKFGFVPSVEFGIKSEYAVSDEFFMAQELVANSLENCSGVISYLPVFSTV